MSERRHAAAPVLAGVAVAITGVLTVTGRTLRHNPAWAPVRRWDVATVEWFAARRARRSNALTRFGSQAADTETAVVLTAAAMMLLGLPERSAGRAASPVTARWRGPLALGLCVGGQLVIYLASATLVGRPRPGVPHLDKEPPTSSFPSGHTSAAVAVYGGAAALLGQRAGRPVRDVLGWVPATAVGIVGFSRVARGMHYPTDVIAGALAGAVWTRVVLRTL